MSRRTKPASLAELLLFAKVDTDSVDSTIDSIESTIDSDADDVELLRLQRELLLSSSNVNASDVPQVVSRRRQKNASDGVRDVLVDKARLLPAEMKDKVVVHKKDPVEASKGWRTTGRVTDTEFDFEALLPRPLHRSAAS